MIRIFAIGSFKRPIKQIVYECRYSPSHRLSEIKEKVVLKQMKTKLIKLKEKNFIFSSSLHRLHQLLITSIAKPSSIISTFPAIKITPQLNDDFLNLFTFLFNGKTGAFSSRLSDCVLFLIQKEILTLSMFWNEFCSYLRESYGSVVTRWTGENEDDELAQKLLAFEKYCSLLMEEREEAKLKNGKKHLIEQLSLWEPFTITSNDQLISPKLQLSSDMQAFKAANPSETFEAFIRWYSPNDWDENEGCLSARMAAQTEWQTIWNDSEPVPIYDQSFTEQLDNFLKDLQQLSMAELVKFCIRRSLNSLLKGMQSSKLLISYSIIQERVRLLESLVDNFCWNEYFLEPRNYPLDEIIEHAMHLELYSLVVEYFTDHFSLEQIQESILEGEFCLTDEWDFDECSIFEGKSKESQTLRFKSSNLQIFAVIGPTSFDILEGQCDEIKRVKS